MDNNTFSAWHHDPSMERVDADVAARRKYPKPPGWFRQTEGTAFALVWCPSPTRGDFALRDGSRRVDGWDYRTPLDRPWEAHVHGPIRHTSFHATDIEAMSAVDEALRAGGAVLQ